MELNKVIVDTKNKPVLDENQVEQRIVDFCVLGVLSAPSSLKAEGKDKVKRAKLGHKLLAENYALTSEEITLLKDCVAETCMPWVVLQVWKVLDPKSVDD